MVAVDTKTPRLEPQGNNLGYLLDARSGNLLIDDDPDFCIICHLPTLTVRLTVAVVWYLTPCT